MKTLGKLAAGLGVAAGAYALFIRPRLMHWGATRQDLEHPFPGARIIPGCERGATMAVTLDAPPSAVWPWLAQMGFDRAGWYSWDRLDRSGIPSARELHPEWQSLSVGQRIASTADGKHWFEIAALVPGRFLALRAAMSGTTQYDSANPRPRKFSDSLWAFHLKELAGGRTRLVVAVYSAHWPRLWNALQSWLFWEPAHFIMQVRQFSNLKRRVEGRSRLQSAEA